MNKSNEITINSSAKIGKNAILNQPFRDISDGSNFRMKPSQIDAGVLIEDFAVIGTGVKIGKRSVVTSFSKIEPNAIIGKNCLIQYNSIICAEAVIGDDSIIGGFVTERTILGRDCRFFGSAVHKHRSTTKHWDSDEAREPSPKLSDGCFVGFGAILVGNISIGKNSYIAAGAIVTKDVPENTSIKNKNEIFIRRID